VLLCALYLEYFHCFTLMSNSDFPLENEAVISLSSKPDSTEKNSNFTSLNTGAAGLLLLQPVS
ncbi:hypothetical protein P3392_24270, partial [Vibrio parahaemolyticus]|nr:hypothetical protein [Vibrio parahaemolyticus]